MTHSPASTPHLPIPGTGATRTMRVLIVVLILLLVGFIAAATGAVYLNTPPKNFPVNTPIIIEDGMTVRDVADMLSEVSVVRSSFMLYVLVVAVPERHYVLAGTYAFPHSMSANDVARVITTGAFATPSIVVTFPEGFRAANITRYLPEAYADADIAEAIAYEGYLFPDTYHIPSHYTLHDVITLMRETYERKMRDVRPLIAERGMTEAEVIILASILEREANDPVSMRMVAGILMNRLRNNMPLQVDAAFDYLLGKESKELTRDDLAIDSPYNTYTNLGLTPTPISNPGLEAIYAVLNPAQTEYLYYLTGNDGTFYYAKTFEEHKENKFRHLR